MSIMNMPPLPYLKRIPGLATDTLRGAFTDATVWDSFDPAMMTLCSPDPQAFRPPDEKINVLQVTLPTNFKVARFDSEQATAMLRQLEATSKPFVSIQAMERSSSRSNSRSTTRSSCRLPKWAMLLTGNYRCVQKDAARSIKEAVHTDIEASRSVYNWVVDLCVKLGASRDDLVPFEKYAAAAQVLVRPSSAARALFAGAPNIERVDRLVQSIAAQHGLRNPVVDETVAMVDARLGL